MTRYLPFGRERFHPARTLLVARVTCCTIISRRSRPDAGASPPDGCGGKENPAFAGSSGTRSASRIAHSRLQILSMYPTTMIVQSSRDEASTRGESRSCPRPHARAARSLLEASPQAPAQPRIAFVGTFDSRKGELPDEAEGRGPHARCEFRLLGAQYRDTTRSFVISTKFRASLEVQLPRFEPGTATEASERLFAGDLPVLSRRALALVYSKCLRRPLQVIAYDAPGPPMMLPPGVPRSKRRRAGHVFEEDWSALSGACPDGIAARPSRVEGRG